jgi:hypothetical protein
MEIQNSSLELLNSLLMDAGLLMAVPLITLTQFVLTSLLTNHRSVDMHAADCQEFPEESAWNAEPAAGITHCTAGVELKRAPKAERQFRRRKAIVIER